MANKVIVEKSFNKPAKNLARKYSSFSTDLKGIERLKADALLGVSLGSGVRKIRLAIKSKGKGKSGGARVITYVYLEGSRIHLLTVFDKSDRESISDEELMGLISAIDNEME